MALNIPELVNTSAADIFAVFPQVSQNDHINCTFGTDAGASLLTYCTPVGYNATTGYYGEWVAPDPAILTVDIDGSTGGTWGMTVDGIVIANTVFDDAETAAVVKSTILASTGIIASVDLTAGVYTITFDADAQIANVPVTTGDVTQLTGGSTPTAVPTAGTSTFGLSTIIGFVWPEEIQLSATVQQMGEVMVEGRISYTYIEPTVDGGDVAALQAELKRTPLGRGIIVEDLVNIH